MWLVLYQGELFLQRVMQLDVCLVKIFSWTINLNKEYFHSSNFDLLVNVFMLVSY